jgi:hypothetical protein
MTVRNLKSGKHRTEKRVVQPRRNPWLESSALERELGRRNF